MTQASEGKGKGKGFSLPILQGILPIDRAGVGRDVIAGFTLAALSIPGTMGYTKIIGTPVITGLYTILIPMSLFAIFGSSRHLSVNADSATAAVVAAGLAGMAVRGSNEWLALCSLIALMAAAFMFLARVMRLGFLADFLSRTVLTGFLTGVGVQVSLLEVSGLLGVHSTGNHPLTEILHDVRSIGETNPYAVAVSLRCWLVIVGGRKISQKIPGRTDRRAGRHRGQLGDESRRPPRDPGRGTQRSADAGAAAARLELAADLETAADRPGLLRGHSCAERGDLARLRRPLRRSLSTRTWTWSAWEWPILAPACPVPFIVNGSPTNTEMVASGGGRSQVSQLTTSAIVLLVLLFLTGPLAYLPTAVLSAIVFLVAVKMIDIQGMRRIYSEARAEFWVALLTAATVVVVGVEQGIVLAMVLSLLDHVRRGYRGNNTVIAADKRKKGWQMVPLNPAQQIAPGLLVYCFSHSLYYANCAQFSEEVLGLAKTGAPAPLDCLCVEAAAIGDVDFSAAAMLRSVCLLLREQGIRLVFANVSPALHAQFDRHGLTELLGANAIYGSVHAVIVDHEEKVAAAAATTAIDSGESGESDKSDDRART
jgi:SulP family sulfate permease